MTLTFLLLFYQLCILAGALTLTRALLRRWFPGLGGWECFLLAVGFFPVAVTWAGLAGLFRIPGMAMGLGAVCAFWALVQGYLWLAEKRPWGAWLRGYGEWLALGAGLTALFIAAHGCYWIGGINNADEVRGVYFIVTLAANYLKPAWGLDFSVPVSYSYYYYQLAAFPYAAVNGLGWPSPILAPLGWLAIFIFYGTVLRCVRYFVPQAGRWTQLFALLAVTFWGLDSAVNQAADHAQHIEWWNGEQITQMASMWYWTYHYLLALALGLEALLCLARAVARPARDAFVAAAIFLCLAVTIAAVTGTFMTLACLAAVALWGFDMPWRTVARAVPKAALWSAVIVLPQIFTFLGRGGFLIFETTPRLMFSRVPLAAARWEDWRDMLSVLYFELGPLLFAGLAALPFYGLRQWRHRPNPARAMAGLAAWTVYSVTFMRAATNDWYFRGGYLLLPVLAAIALAWVAALAQHRRFLYGAMGAVCVLGLWPGVQNFMAEQRYRAHWCVAPPSHYVRLNRLVNLHTNVFNDAEPRDLIYLAGRTNILPKVAVNANYLWAYIPSVEWLKRWVDWPGEVRLCRQSWYGAATPTPFQVKISLHEGKIAAEFTDCDQLFPKGETDETSHDQKTD